MIRLLLLVIPLAASAQYTPANAEWDRPAEPFRILENIYYVGASDVSAYLITTLKSC